MGCWERRWVLVWGWRQRCSPTWVYPGPQPGCWDELVSCPREGEAGNHAHCDQGLPTQPFCHFSWVVISSVHQWYLHPTELTWHSKCCVVLSPMVIHWWQMVVIMHSLWQCSGVTHEIPLVFREHNSCSESWDELQEWGKSGHNPEAATKSSGWFLQHIWHRRPFILWARTDVTKSRLQNSLAVWGLHWCQLEFRSRVWCSMRWGAYSQMPEFSIQCSPGHLKQTFHVPASFDIMLCLYSDSAPVVWHIHTIFPITCCPQEGNVGAWAGRELLCTPAETLLCSAGLRCNKGRCLPSFKAWASLTIRALNECSMQFPEPCVLANLGCISWGYQKVSDPHSLCHANF